MIERKQNTTTTPATSTPTRTPQAPASTTPKAAPSAPTPKMARDSVTTKTPNPYDESPARTGADVISGTSSTAEVLKDARSISQIAQTAGSRAPWLARVGSSLARFATKIADVGDNIAAAAPKLAKGFLGFAKAAPLIGAGVAVLDVAKAVNEKDPQKKRVAEGQAALSVVGGAAGLIGLAAIATPLAPVLIGVGIGTAVLSVADTFLFKGAVSKTISDGMHAVADVGKKAWSALTSL